MLLHEIVELAASERPDGLAIALGDTTIGFAALHERVTRLAGGVQALTEPGDRVAIVGENDLPWVDCYYGVPKAGRVLAFLNHRLAPAELAALVTAAEASVLVAPGAVIAALRDGPAAIPSVRVTVSTGGGGGDLDYAELLAAGPFHPPAGQGPGDVCWLIHTSGTTGLPKGAMLTHASLTAATLALGLARPVAPDDVYLFPFPLCHVAGYNVLALHLHRRPVVLLPRFDPAAIVEAVRRRGVTSVSLAPTMISTLVDHLEAAGVTLPTLRSVGYGASSIPPALLARALTGLGAEFSQGYGMTELSGNAVFLGPEHHRRGLAGEPGLLAAAGLPSPLVALRLVDDDLRDVTRGAVGEILVRGDQVMAGYWRDPGATADVLLPGGWLRTGDLGRRDEEGHLYVVDRKKDVIVTGGENVSSREVEDVIQSHPEVLEAAVVGVPDPHWGENVCAVVVPRPGATLTPDALVGFVRERLAGFKKPKRVVFAERLPRNASGKVLKARLRAELAGPDPPASRDAASRPRSLRPSGGQ